MYRRAFLTTVGLGGLSVACSRPSPSPGPTPENPHTAAGSAASGKGLVETRVGRGSGSPEERVIGEDQSDFNRVFVTEDGPIRRMYFEVEGRWLLQSTYDLDRPDALHHEVFQTMIGSLLVQPKIERMCMIGLGGGQLSNYLYRIFPELELDVVDICPAVVRLARAHFGVPDDPRYRLHVDDGRVFVERQASASLDLVVHDAYRGHSIPKHLRTQEFFAAIAERLRPEGVVVANMHRSKPRYVTDRATMAAVYAHCYRFTSTDDVQTSVVSTMADKAQNLEQLIATAEQLQPRFDFDLRGLAGRCRIDEEGWDPSAIPRDDFDESTLDDAARRHNLSCDPKCDGDGM